MSPAKICNYSKIKLAPKNLNYPLYFSTPYIDKQGQGVVMSVNARSKIDSKFIGNIVNIFNWHTLGQYLYNSHQNFCQSTEHNSNFLGQFLNFITFGYYPIDKTKTSCLIFNQDGKLIYWSKYNQYSTARHWSSQDIIDVVRGVNIFDLIDVSSRVPLVSENRYGAGLVSNDSGIYSEGECNDFKTHRLFKTLSWELSQGDQKNFTFGENESMTVKSVMGSNLFLVKLDLGQGVQGT